MSTQAAFAHTARAMEATPQEVLYCSGRVSLSLAMGLSVINPKPSSPPGAHNSLFAPRRVLYIFDHPVKVQSLAADGAP